MRYGEVLDARSDGRVRWVLRILGVSDGREICMFFRTLLFVVPCGRVLCVGG